MQERLYPIRLYVVEEQELMRTAFCSLLGHDERLEVVGSSSSIEESIHEIGEVQPHVVVVKVEGRGDRLVDPICRLKNATPHVAVMVLLEDVTEEVVANYIQSNVSAVCSKTIGVAGLLLGIRAAADGCIWLGPNVAGCLRTLVAKAAVIKTANEDRPRSIGSGLTDRETEILAAMARGLTNQQIAAELLLSIETVKTYIRRIMDKSSIRTRRELRTCFAEHKSSCQVN
jgi:DNA-binding NarL/FixJ family response regulator